MMKSFQLGACKARLTILIIAIAAFCFSSGTIGQEAFKIGVVNTEEVLKASDAATKATEQLRAAGEKLQKNLEKSDKHYFYYTFQYAIKVFYSPEIACGNAANRRCGHIFRKQIQQKSART